MLGTQSIFTSMGMIEKSVNAAVSGIEKARAVISGIYDEILMQDRAAEYWQKRTFEIRANEIEHLRKLGQLSAQEEAQLWKQLFDEKEYGWANVKIAEENYHKAMFEHSSAWIEEQTELGKLSAQEVAEAWGRVFEAFDDVNIKYQAAMNIRSVLLGEADSETADRRKDSDRWMSRQDMYDGGDTFRQVEDYTRRIDSEKQLLKEIESGFLNGVELGTVEQAKRWTEVYEYIEDLEDARYSVAKKNLQDQIDDYISETKAALKEQYDYRLSLYDSELTALKEKYDSKNSSRRQSKLSEELGELTKQKGYYKDAVTKEGQEKYKEIVSKISDIYDEQQEIRDKERYAEEEAQLKEKIASLKKDYQSSVDGLEQSKNNMLQMTGQAALQSIATAEKAGGNISGVLLSINNAFSSELERMFEKTHEYLSRQTSKIADLFALTGISSAGAAASSDTNVNVTFNDYGDKNLSEIGRASCRERV